MLNDIHYVKVTDKFIVRLITALLCYPETRRKNVGTHKKAIVNGASAVLEASIVCH